MFFIIQDNLGFQLPIPSSLILSVLTEPGFFPGIHNTTLSQSNYLSSAVWFLFWPELKCFTEEMGHVTCRMQCKMVSRITSYLFHYPTFSCLARDEFLRLGLWAFSLSHYSEINRNHGRLHVKTMPKPLMQREIRNVVGLLVSETQELIRIWSKADAAKKKWDHKQQKLGQQQSQEHSHNR